MPSTYTRQIVVVSTLLLNEIDVTNWHGKWILMDVNLDYLLWMCSGKHLSKQY